MQIMPRDNPWNENVSGRPPHPSSAAIIARIKADLAVDRRTLRAFYEMNFVVIGDGQALADMRLVTYPDESDDVLPDTDIARYPFPANLPIETWPIEHPDLTLDEWQRDTADGDRHSITVRPATMDCWETWQARRYLGRTPAWESSNLARFHLNSNALRHDGWTSGDAAGLPMFPALVRYDEVQRGAIHHALRIVVKKTRNSYIYPATHFASTLDDADLPPMGLRLRLKSTTVIPGTWTAQSRVVAAALKTYGALVADNGGFLSISVTPDDRWPEGCFDDLRNLLVDDFEAVQSTGPNEGPRSPGAPTADAGSDRAAAIGVPILLSGSVTGSNLVTTWYVYPLEVAPGAVQFGTPNALETSATFAGPGIYRILLRATDGVHTPAYDCVVVRVGGTRRVGMLFQDMAPLPVRVSLPGFPDQDTDAGGRVLFTGLQIDDDACFSFLGLLLLGSS